MSLEIVSNLENPLFHRREVQGVFGGVAGRLPRGEARRMVAEALGVPQETVYPIRLAGEAGRPDIKGTFYVYEKEADARRQLPRHLFLRLLPKEERKKERAKRKKAETKPASGKK